MLLKTFTNKIIKFFRKLSSFTVFNLNNNSKRKLLSPMAKPFSLCLRTSS